MSKPEHDPKGKVKIKLKDHIKAGAIMSSCQHYRYELSREWGNADTSILWIGMNPSTADANFDDPTCGREVRFSKDWGFNRYLKVNVLDWRATFPKDIPTDPKIAASAEGRAHLLKLASESQMVMAVWGKLPPKLAHQAHIVAELLQQKNIPLMCLGQNKDGSPKHPLYLKANLEPRLWIAP
jgi:hypothetical protein